MKVIDTEKLPIKMWLDEIEGGALRQAKNLANLPFAFKWIAIMPDSHEGYGMPIGGVLAAERVIIPNAVGVDIGCGVVAAKTSLTEIDLDTIKKIMGKSRDLIPVGFKHQKADQSWDGFDEAPDYSIIKKELSSARRQLGTLGGGNHFIEIQAGNDGHIWLMIHSGSRNIGLKVAGYYNKLAKSLCEKWHSGVTDKDLAFLPFDTDEGREYYDAMSFCLRFARANRALMMKRMLEIVSDITGAEMLDELDIHHNYAAIEHHYGKNVLVHRKGATKAGKGQRGIIPGSMGTSSYIVTGLGNPESFESCSHGAGRKMGRKEASRSLDLKEEQEKMKGIVHGLRSVKELDEAPGAYKDIDSVMENQKDLVEIVVKLEPLAVIKG
jgi:tRNA-splicing ligase RtcB